MSYPIANSVLELFKDQQRQVAEITLYGTDETIHLTEKDILQGGLTIDRYCVSGSRIEIGSAIASELALTLNNNDGRFNDVVFEGAELFVKIGIKKWEARRWENAVIHYIPMGYFTVDNSPRKLASISLSALDRMVMFDKECRPPDLSFPINIADLLVRICSKCNVTLATDSRELTNAQYIVKSFPEGENITYRQILMWIAEITGTCAYIDWNGHLRLEWYSNESSVMLSPDVRYSSDMNDKSIQITGVQVAVDDDNVYLQGTDEYAFSIEANALLQENIETVITSLYEKLKGFSYTPYSCVSKPFVHLYPLDRIIFEDNKGNKVSSIVTNTTFTMNSNLQIAGQGETETSDGYAKSNPLTKRETTIINGMKKAVDTKVTSRQQALLNLNETIVNSLGLYRSEETQEDGSVIYYYHDQASKDESSIIYTFRAGGFAWTDDWNDGEPIWQNGIDKSGNAVLKILSAYQINADHIEAGCITAEKLASNSVTAEKIAASSITAEKITMAAIQDRWNEISEYVQINSSSLDIYNSSNLKLMSLDSSGMSFYRDENEIGTIGTSYWTDKPEYRGLVFNLEKDAGWMSWSVWNPSRNVYETKLAYHTATDTSIAAYGAGLYFDCPAYALDELYIDDKVKFYEDTYISNANQGGLYFRYKNLFFLRMNTATSNWVDAFWIDVIERGKCKIHCGGTLDMGNFSIINQSDSRLKTNIKNVEFSAVDLLNSIDIKSYDWIKTDEHENAGIIAQQIEQVIPSLVTTENKAGVKSINMLQFIPYLIKAIQELSTKVYNQQWDTALWDDLLSEQEKREFVLEAEMKQSPVITENQSQKGGNSHE